MEKNHIEQLIESTRVTCKENIVRLLTLIYIKHNGDFPKWFDDEDIVVEDSELGSTSRISMEVSNTHDETTCTEKWEVQEYHVDVNGYLYFWCNDSLEEIEWTEVSTDELVSIYTKIHNYWNKINR